MSPRFEVRNLFPGNGRDRGGLVGDGPIKDYQNGTFSAMSDGKGGYFLEHSAINFTDARVMGHGHIYLVSKAYAGAPDFQGSITAPQDYNEKPAQFSIKGWLKDIQKGPNIGKKYLTLRLTETVPEQACATNNS